MVEKLRTIRKEGGSRVLVVTDLIPVDWSYVNCKIVKSNNNDNSITVKIKKVS